MKITDNQTLTGAKTRSGYKIKTYDEGYGPLWIHRNPIGISGIVRARTESDAYSICEDEFFPEASETVEEMQYKYGFKREYIKIIRAKNGEVRRDTINDYPLEAGQFVRWNMVETRDDTPGSFADNELWQAAFGFRPNGPNSSDIQGHGIYAIDLNGDILEPLTDELCDELEIALEITEG